MKKLLLISSLFCLLGPGLARADVTIETRMGDKTQIVYVAPHMFSAGGADGGVIFRGDKKLLYKVNPRDSTYTTITEKDAQALGAQVNSAMSQLQEAMKNMPPDQRAMVEKMMQGKMPSAQEATRSVREMGVNKSINGFDCAGYEVTESDGASMEVWAADPKSVDVKPEDLTAFKDLGDFLHSMLPQMAGMQEMIKDYEHPKATDVPGLPILTIKKDKEGKELWRAEVVKITRGEIAPARFEVPAGYRERELSTGGPQGR